MTFQYIRNATGAVTDMVLLPETLEEYIHFHPTRFADGVADTRRYYAKERNSTIGAQEPEYTDWEGDEG